MVGAGAVARCGAVRALASSEFFVWGRRVWIAKVEVVICSLMVRECFPSSSQQLDLQMIDVELFQKLVRA